MPQHVPSEDTPLLIAASSDQDEHEAERRSYLKKVAAVALALCMLCLATVAVMSRNSGGETRHSLCSGCRYQLQAIQGSLYLRADPSTGALVLSSSVPWFSGSTFELLKETDNCVKFRSMRGKWVTASSGPLRATEDHSRTGDCFDLHSLSDGSVGIFRPGVTGSATQYVSISAVELYLDGTYVNQLVLSDSLSMMNLFRLRELEPIRGVNLGGWFIPEYWMQPAFYAGTGLTWNSSLCLFVKMYRGLAERRMASHLASWLTDTDFARISALGLNSVRVPIGYWNVIEDPYDMFVPKNHSLSLAYLDWCFEAAAQYNISVLVDLHGAPGSQNGNDHSGCASGEHWMNNRNIDLTLRAIEAIAKRYSSRKNLLGIELLNEPSASMEIKNFSEVLDFYHKAYKKVRMFSDTALVVINELDGSLFDAWHSILQEPRHYNVVMDLHLYDWQQPFTEESAAQHLNDAKSWRKLIESESKHHPVIVGEWSFSTAAAGWYVWTWKVQPDVGFDMWSVSLQSNISNGVEMYLN